MISEEVLRKEREEIDITLFGAIALLIFFGMAALYSSTFYSQNISFVMQAGITLTIGTLALFLGMAIRTDYWRYVAKPLFVITLLLLVLVLFKGVKINNARRWLKIWHFKIQISELAKVSLILLLAHMLDEVVFDVKDMKTFSKFIGIIVFSGLLIAIEPSISAAFILILTGGIMVFYSGSKLRHIFVTILLGLILFISFILLYPHARNRITSKTRGKSAELYQVKQSKIAIANGGLTGRGPGRGLAKYRYLPEISNDFIFALIAEEFGFIGSTLIVILFLIIAIKGFSIARQHVLSTYKSTLAMGITFLFSVQAALHIGINTGILPPTGVVLPFVSYGKLAILTNMFLAGVLLRLSYEIEDRMEI